MSPRIIRRYWRSINFSEFQCYLVFLILASPVILIIRQAAGDYRVWFHLLLLFTGFLTFTFLEYIAHRFWMHDEKDRTGDQGPGQHFVHHNHPMEIRITIWLRIFLLLTNALVLMLAVFMDNYFTILAGFYSGFVYYCFLHVMLHSPFAKRIFPKLQVAHIYHHCHFPYRCFGTCLACWDELFNTGLPRDFAVPDRMIQRYFRDKNP